MICKVQIMKIMQSDYHKTNNEILITKYIYRHKPVPLYKSAVNVRLLVVVNVWEEFQHSKQILTKSVSVNKNRAWTLKCFF